MKKPLYLALALLPGLASAAQPQRALRTIHCQFENGVTIDGERAAADRNFSDMWVTTSMFFATKNMRASLGSIPDTIQFAEAVDVSLDGGGRNFYFRGAYDRSTDRPQDVKGTLECWAGKTDGTCRIEIADGHWFPN